MGIVGKGTSFFNVDCVAEDCGVVCLIALVWLVFVLGRTGVPVLVLLLSLRLLHMVFVHHFM